MIDIEGAHTLWRACHKASAITHSQPKQLIPVANKPILFYPIEDVIEAIQRLILDEIKPESSGELIVLNPECRPDH